MIAAFTMPRSVDGIFFHRLIQAFSAVVIVLCLAWPAQASAKGAVLITHGDTIADLGPIAAMPDGEDGDELRGHKVGYKYSYFGLFWLDAWTWDGEFCVFEGNNFMPVSQEMATALLGKSASAPVFYRLPPLLLLILAFVAFKILTRSKDQDAAEPAPPAE